MQHRPALLILPGARAKPEGDGGQVLDHAVVEVAGDPVAFRVRCLQGPAEQQLLLSGVCLPLQLRGVGA